MSGPYVWGGVGPGEAYKVGTLMPVSSDLLTESIAAGEAIRRYFAATPEERAHWATEAKTRRAAEREGSPHVALTFDALLDKLGWSLQYAEHVVQPCCECRDGYDGWERCEHAYDLDLEVSP